MRRRLLFVTLGLAGSALALPVGAAAQGPFAVQGPSQEEVATRVSLGASSPDARTRSTPVLIPIVLPDSVVRKDHTVTGLLIGAGLGFAAGWGFYNAMCEAVNNKCSGSRVRSALIGSAVVGSLGALIGSLDN